MHLFERVETMGETDSGFFQLIDRKISFDVLVHLCIKRGDVCSFTQFDKGHVAVIPYEVQRTVIHEMADGRHGNQDVVVYSTVQWEFLKDTSDGQYDFFIVIKRKRLPNDISSYVLCNLI